MKKRVVAMMLSVTIVAGMISGCGRSKDSAPMVDVAAETMATYEYEASTSDTACEEPAQWYDNGAGEAYEKSASYAETASADRTYETEAMTDSAYASEASKAYGAEEMIINESFDVAPYRGNGEKYTATTENAPVEVSVNALSTFGADVDTASYTNLRRMINDGYALSMISPDAVRTEEIVNYFKYNYKEPKKGDVFGVNAQVSTCPWNKEALLLTLGVNTATLDSRDVPDCNIVFLIDVSGSMSGSNKLPLIQKTMAMLADNFDNNDRISIVTYASGVSTVLDGCKGGNSRKIMKAFESLSAGGSTNGGDGIKLAYDVAERNFIKKGVNRVIICSDGDFNVGLTTQKELEKLISDKKDSGIFLSTLGFGMGNYSDTTMETLADKGNGNYAYIDDLTEAKRVLVDEMTSTFVTVAKDVKFQVEFNPAVVSKYRLVGYENRVMAAADFKDDTKDGGEMGAGHQVTVIYEIYPSKGGNETELKYQDTNLSKKGQLSDEYCTLSIAYKAPTGDKSSYLEYPIGVECFSSNPSEDFKLAAAAAQASLALKNSEYLVEFNQMEALESSVNIINKLSNKYEDEYVGEFAELLNILMNNDYGYEWYE